MNILLKMYHGLYRAFGPQNWWPGDTPFEVAVGAILTQNTNWGNVEKAIQNLKKHKVLSAEAIHGMPEVKLAGLIRPAGYYNIKAKRLKSFIGFLMNDYHGSMSMMQDMDVSCLRERLLGIHGIGQETADSILLYALGKPVFVIDAYTKRVLSRHNVMDGNKSYGEFQEFFYSSMKRDVNLFNEYHALFVQVGKKYCKRREPLCNDCPLRDNVFRARSIYGRI